MKLYLETSAISGSLAKDEPRMMKFSNQLLKSIKVKLHQGFISTLVLEEIDKSPIRTKIKLERIINNLRLITLEVNEKALKLAQKYVEASLIPETYRADAIHIAVATINTMDALISWNLSHIVKLKTIKGVKEINKVEGYPLIDIVTPEMVVGWKK